GIHQGYQHDNDTRTGRARAIFTVALPEPGLYDVQVAWAPNGNRASNAPVHIVHADGESTATVNQRKRPPIGGLFGSVGKFRFEKEGTVTISNSATDGFVSIDAVRWVKVE